MKIIMTGATGFIGGNLIKKLLDRGHDVTVLVRPSSDMSRVDIRASLFRYCGEIEEIIGLFQNKHFDGVIHLASLFLASHQSQDIPPLILSNVQLGTELLEGCKRSQTKWFINTGTFWQHYHNEEYNPINLYAATKQAFEAIAKYYTETSELLFTTVKLSDTFGPEDTREKIFNLWNKASQTGERLTMSPGDQIIDLCYIDDVVSAFEILLDQIANNPEEIRNKTFAVHSAQRLPLKELAGVFEESSGRKLNIEWGGRAYREREVMIPWENGLPVPGWTPKYTLKEAIQKTLGAIK
jgi:nucleoside-diphosphate-sugar epimerase